MNTIEVLNTVIGRTAKYIGTYDMWFPHGDVNKPYTRAWWTHTMLLNGLNHTVLMSFRPLDTEFFLGMNGAGTSGGNDILPYGDGVTDQASFDDRRNAVLTAADPLKNAYVDGTKFGWHGKPANSATMPWAEGDGDCGKWSDWPDRTMSNYGSIDPEHRMTYTASLGNLDYLRSLPTQTWADKWETWEHVFANAYYLAKNWPDYFNGRVLFWNSTNSNDFDVSGTDIYSSGVALMRDAVEQAMIKAGKSSSAVSVTFGHDDYDLSLADSGSAPFYDRGVRHTYDMSPMGDLRTAGGTLSRPVYLAYNEFSSTHGTAGQGVVSSMTESEGKDLLWLTNRFNLAGEGLQEYDQYIPWHPMAEKNYTLSTPINKDGNTIFGGGGTYSNYVWTDDYYDNPPTFWANPGMYYFISSIRVWV